MTRARAGIMAVVLVGLAGGCSDAKEESGVVAPDLAAQGFSASGSDGDRNGFSGNDRIAIRDDCDPRDPGWIPTGGCARRRGDVTLAEFNMELDSPLALSVVGHQAWRNDPSYLEIEPRRRVRVTNEGGRAHPFTKVANFGGGKVPSPDLNEGLLPAPECPGSVNILPGGRMDIMGLSEGNHRFQCCIHPWMRALIKVEAHDGGHRGEGRN